MRKGVHSSIVRVREREREKEKEGVGGNSRGENRKQNRAAGEGENGTHLNTCVRAVRADNVMYGVVHGRLYSGTYGGNRERERMRRGGRERNGGGYKLKVREQEIQTHI